MKILLVQTSFLGDTILSTPVIAALAKIHAGAEIWMMTTPASAQLVERDPLLAGVIPFDKRGAGGGMLGMRRMAKLLASHRFDIAYSLHRSARTSIVLKMARIPERIGFSQSRLSFLYTRTVPRSTGEHDVLRNLSLLRPEVGGLELDLDLRLFEPALDAVSEKVRTFVSALDDYIVMVPGSAWKTKMWHWENYRDVASWFLKRGRAVTIVGAPSEVDVCSRVAEGLSVTNLAGETSVEEMMCIIKRARLVICNDSMALHMASAFKVPTVAIFCATSPEFGFTPWRNRATVLEKKGLACKPCSRHGNPACPTGTEICMRELAPHAVISASLELLDSPERRTL